MPRPTPIAERPPRPASDPLTHDERRARRPQAERPLRRSRDRRVAGVAGGIAAFIGADPSVVRWVFALSLIPSTGTTGVGYLLLWLLLPVEPLQAA